MHQTELQCTRGVETLATEKITPRRTRSDRGYQVGRYDRRDQTEAHFGQTENRIFRRNRDIATGNQPDPTTIARALHSRDYRFMQSIEPVHQLRKPFRVGEILREIVVGHAPHPVEIGTGAKTLARSTQYQNSNRFILVDIVKSL